MCTKGMRHHKKQHAGTVLKFDPSLDHGGSKCRQIVQQVAFDLKNGPEFLWHGKTDSEVRNVRKASSYLVLPYQPGAVSTYWAGPRFAGVEDELFLDCRSIYFHSQRCCPAINHLSEILSGGRPSPGMIPQRTISPQEILERLS